MSEDQFDEFLALRKPGAHLEGQVKVNDEFAQQLGIDLVNYPKFDKAVSDDVTFAKGDLDIRWETDVDSGAELEDYSGPYRPDFRFTDFSKQALVSKVIPFAEEYTIACVDGWAEEITRRFGEEAMAEIEWAAWNELIAPEIPRWIEEFLPEGTVYEDPNQAVPEDERATTRVDYRGLFTPNPEAIDLPKPDLVRWLLGAHEYLLQCIEAWATQVILRSSLDEMFDIQYVLWGDTVLPAAKRLKEQYLGITGNQVEDWMKDLHIDATSMPGKAFDLTFDMPEEGVGTFAFNRCVAVDQWEGMGRPDILEKNCHSTCPKSMIVTTQMYNPNMKVEILAIPPRKAEGDVCCKWKFSMRDESDPEYVPVELGPRPVG